MCNNAVEKDPYRLGYVPDRYKKARVCEKIVEREPRVLMYVPKRLKTQEMCEKAVEADPWQLYYTPDRFKTQKMCEDVVRRDPYSLLGVPDCLVTSQQIKIWRDGTVTIAIMRMLSGGTMDIKNGSLRNNTNNWCMPKDEKRLWKLQIICFKNT